MNLGNLKEMVEEEISSYEYHCPKGMVGNPVSQEWINEQLAEAVKALKEPYTEKMWLQDTYDQVKDKENRIENELIVVADDGEFKIFYDSNNNEFGLAQYSSGEMPITIGVRGDFVGCFMAR